MVLIIPFVGAFWRQVYQPRPIGGSVVSQLFKVGPGAVSLMNMACVAFTTHYNGINYYTELKDRSLPRFVTAVGLGFVWSFSIFALMMAFGFKTFGAAAQPLLLNNYHRTDDPLATLSRFATGFSILCGFPLMFAGLKTGFFSAYRSSVDSSKNLRCVQGGGVR
jgi:amino acid permease